MPTSSFVCSTPKHLLWAGLLVLAMWGSIVSHARAAAPPNDVCANAALIPASGPFPYLTSAVDINQATTNGDTHTSLLLGIYSEQRLVQVHPSRDSGLHDLHLFRCPDGDHRAGHRDGHLHLECGGCPGATNELVEACSSQGCADDSCGPGGLQAALTTTLFADTTYYIVVWRYDDEKPPEPDHTLVQLRVVKSVPANDNCLGAVPLLLDRPVKGSTAGAENNYQLDPICLTNAGAISSPAAGPDVAYSFTAPTAGDYSFKVFNYSTTLVMDVRPDLVLYLVESCPGASGLITFSNCLAAVNRNRVNSAEELVCVPLAAGQRVYLIVDQNGCTPGSSFTVEMTRCRHESEPNDTSATASVLTCGVIGAIASDDMDFFALGAPAAESRAFVFLDGGAATVTDFNLRLVTATDTLEYDAQDNDEMFGSLSPNLAGVPLTGQQTFVQVTAGSLGAEPYRLYVAVQPPLSSATPETEPNNTLGQANSADNSYFYGSLAGAAPSTDMDLYAFSAEAGDLIFLSLDCDPLRNNTPIDGQLELLDAAGNVLVTVNDGFNLGSPCSPATLSRTNTDPANLTATTPFSPGEGLVYRTPVDATYLARVSIGTLCTQARGAGDYLLSISRNCPTCCLQLRFVGIERTADERTILNLLGVPLTTYQIEATSDFISWKNVGSSTTDSGGFLEFEDTTGALSSRFYRASLSQ